MAKNNRVAKEVIKYSLRLDPKDYKIIQQKAEESGIAMNALLQKIIAEFTNDEKITSKEQLVLDEIKSLPLKEQKAIIKKLSGNN